MKKIWAATGIVAVLGIGLLAAGNAGSGIQGAHQPLAFAPDFTLEKLGGGTVSLADYKGKKPVVLDFWASWCPNCRRDMPHLNQFYQAYKNTVEVIGINLQENPETVRDFIAAQGISYPIVLDPYGQTSSAYGVQYTNYHVLIDKSGRIVRAIPGDIRESDLALLASG